MIIIADSSPCIVYSKPEEDYKLGQAEEEERAQVAVHLRRAQCIGSTYSREHIHDARQHTTVS